MSSSDRTSATSRVAVRPAKPSELGLVEPVLPDGASENFRFIPIPVEARQTGNDASAGPIPAAAESSAVSDDFTPTQRLAISALMCGGTLSSAAARVGVSVRTLYKWRHEPAFAAELTRRSEEALEANCVRARNLILKSTQVLAESLLGNDRFRWALRMVQANRLWEMSQVMPATPDVQADSDRVVDALTSRLHAVETAASHDLAHAQPD